MKQILHRLNSLPNGVKSSIGLFLASIISSGIAYITTPIYTRLLSAEQYGQVSVFFTWMSVFGIVAMFNLSYGVFNNGMLEHPNNRDEYSLSMLGLSNVITVAFGFIVLILYPYIKEYVAISPSYFTFMFLVFLFQPAYNFWAARQRYEYKYKLSLLFTTLIALSSPFVSIMCLLTMDDKIAARIYGAQGAMLVFYIGFYIYLFVKGNRKLTVKYWKDAFLFNLPLLPHYLSMYLLGSADRIMISKMVGDAATAYYSVAHAVATVVIIVWSAANSSLIPYTYEKCKEKDYGSISRVSISILFLFSGACVLLILLAPEIVRIMAKEEYMEAIYVIPPLIGGVFFQVQYNLFGNVLYYFKKPKYVMYASVLATLLNILLNYILIQRFGYLAAGYTTIVCYLFQAVFDYFAMRFVSGSSIYNMKIVITLSCLVLVISLACVLLYDKPFWIRYFIIILLMILVYFNKARVIELARFIAKKEHE